MSRKVMKSVYIQTIITLEALNMDKNLCLKFISTLLFLHLISAKKLKILINSPNVGYSHVQFQGKIADTLVEAGHEVHFLIGMWNEDDYNNGTQKSHRIIRFFTETPTLYKNMEFLTNPFDSNKINNDVMAKFNNVTDQFCIEMIQNGSWLLEELRAENYDVGISECFENCIFGIFEAIGIKTKILTSAIPLPDGLAELFGIPMPRSYVPISMSSPIGVPNLSYKDKAYNLYQDYKLEKFPQNGAARTNKMLRNAFGEDFPDVLDIIRKSSFVFINIPEILDQVKPISNKIVHIGGIALKKSKKLDERIMKIFENSQKGVVLFSFGSLANTDLMPEELKMAYLEAFSTFPEYEFIWKYHLRKNDTLLFSKYPNVHPVEWVDQNSILAQRKTKAFMTHCGLNSFIEGSFNGIPMIATPLFGDQNYNAAIIKHKGTGIYLDLKKVTTMTVTNALKEVLESDRYYKNAQELKKKLTTFPYKPNEKMVKFVEYAAENSIEDELNLPGANMTFIEYFCLDILIPLFVLALLFTYVLYRILSRLITFALYSVVKTKAD